MHMIEGSMTEKNRSIFVRKIRILPRILWSNEHKNYLEPDLSKEGCELMLARNKMTLVRGGN